MPEPDGTPDPHPQQEPLRDTPQGPGVDLEQSTVADNRAQDQAQDRLREGGPTDDDLTADDDRAFGSSGEG